MTKLDSDDWTFLLALFGFLLFLLIGLGALPLGHAYLLEKEKTTRVEATHKNLPSTSCRSCHKNTD